MQGALSQKQLNGNENKNTETRYVDEAREIFRKGSADNALEKFFYRRMNPIPPFPNRYTTLRIFSTPKGKIGERD